MVDVLQRYAPKWATQGGGSMSISSRLKRLEEKRKPKEVTWADYLVAIWSPDPDAALDKLPPIREGTAAWAMSYGRGHRYGRYDQHSGCCREDL